MFPFLLQLNLQMKPFMQYNLLDSFVCYFTADRCVQWNPALRPPRWYDQLIITATFFSPQKNPRSVIFLFKETLLNDHPVNMTNLSRPKGGRINGVPLYYYFHNSFCMHCGLIVLRMMVLFFRLQESSEIEKAT